MDKIKCVIIGNGICVGQKYGSNKVDSHLYSASSESGRSLVFLSHSGSSSADQYLYRLVRESLVSAAQAVDLVPGVRGHILYMTYKVGCF